MFEVKNLYCSVNQRDMLHVVRMKEKEGFPDYYGPYEEVSSAMEVRDSLIKEELGGCASMTAEQLIRLINTVNDDVDIFVTGLSFKELNSFSFKDFDHQPSCYSDIDFEYIRQSGDGDYGYYGTLVFPVSGEMLLVVEYSC